MLEVKDLKFKYTDKELFNNVNFKMFNNEHIVLLGANGCGKSTFMKIIAKNLIQDSGTISWLPNMKVSYLDQHLVIKEQLTINEYYNDVYKDLFELERKMESYYEQLAICKESEYEKYLNWANEIQEKLDEAKFYQFKSSIGNVVNGLGIINFGLDTLLSNLSGGQKVRVFLGKLLLENSNCILMDEPTNFLDTTHIEWLTKYLQGFKGSFIVITHDISFAKDIGNIFYELKDKKFERYKGDFEFYIKESEIRKLQHEKDYNAQQRFIKQTQTFIDKNITRASTSAQAKSRRKILDKLEVIEKAQVDTLMKIKFPFSRNLGEEVLKINNLVIGYDKPLLKPINFTIRNNQKVAIKGHNGIGKSTLLKTILNIIKPIDGDFKFNNSADVVYYSQETNYPDITPLSYVREEFPYLDNERIRTLLSSTGLRNDVISKTMNELSGGQQTKIRLLMLTLTKCNILILDEPTNHLDIKSKEILYNAIKEFNGCVIMVSHDPEFLSDVCNVEINLEIL